MLPSTKYMITALLHVELFHGLAQQQIEAIASIAERVSFRECDVIVHEDQMGDAAYIIVQGVACIESANVRSTQTQSIQPGSIVGEMAMLIDDFRHGATITAAGPVHTLRLAHREMHTLMLRDPSMAEHFVAKIAGKLSRIADELKQIYQILAAADKAA